MKPSQNQIFANERNTVKSVSNISNKNPKYKIKTSIPENFNKLYPLATGTHSPYKNNREKIDTNIYIDSSITNGPSTTGRSK